MKKYKILLIVALILLADISFFYGDHVSAKEAGPVLVMATGATLNEAKNEAKRAIIEQGVGSIAKSRSISVDARSMYVMTTSRTEGFVSNFQVDKILSKPPASQYWEIQASGTADENAIGDSLKNLMENAGKPRVLVIFAEKVGGVAVSPGDTVTENQIVANFPEFSFIDREQYMRILAQERGGIIHAYGNPKAYDQAMALAAELDAEILIIGETNVVSAGKVGKTIMESYQADIKLKMINVGTAEIIGAQTGHGAHPHINPESGANEAIKKAIADLQPSVVSQVSQKWKPGVKIRLTIEGLDYDSFVDNEIVQKINNISGINGVYERSSGNGTGPIIIEVESFFYGPALYQKLRSIKDLLGFDFSQIHVSGNRLNIKVIK
jgi:hypothetical protein